MVKFIAETFKDDGATWMLVQLMILLPLMVPNLPQPSVGICSTSCEITSAVCAASLFKHDFAGERIRLGLRCNVASWNLFVWSKIAQNQRIPASVHMSVHCFIENRWRLFSWASMIMLHFRYECVISNLFTRCDFLISLVLCLAYNKFLLYCMSFTMYICHIRFSRVYYYLLK